MYGLSNTHRWVGFGFFHLLLLPFVHAIEMRGVIYTHCCGAFRGHTSENTGFTPNALSCSDCGVPGLMHHCNPGVVPRIHDTTLQAEPLSHQEHAAELPGSCLTYAVARGAIWCFKLTKQEL